MEDTESAPERGAWLQARKLPERNMLMDGNGQKLLLHENNERYS